MKTLTFRPLRRVKKTGKIVVASYLQWHALRTANYNGPFRLVVVDNYSAMLPDEQVCNHEGEPLLFPAYDPNELPVFSDNSVYSLTKHYEENIAFSYYSDGGRYGSPHTTYHGRGIDCQGTPTFTHFTIDQIATHYKNMNEFERLTVGMVTNWLGWFLLRLENADLKVTR